MSQWFPAVAVNTSNSLAVGFSRAGSAEYASVYYAGREQGFRFPFIMGQVMALKRSAIAAIG